MVKFYAVMCVLGTILPYGALISWVLESGELDIAALVAEIADSRISMLAWFDVLVSAVVLVVFIRTDGRRESVSMLWAPIAGTCLVGVSLGLPLFLLMRERAMRRYREDAVTGRDR